MILDLACIGCTLSANGHKLLVGFVGLSLVAAAFFVRRQRRSSSRGTGHAFEVVARPDVNQRHDGTNG